MRGLTSVILVAASRCFSATSSTAIKVPAETLEAVKGLQPEPLWSQFAILSSIPRPSKKEDDVIEYIRSFANERNLKWKQDSIGNLVVFHPGTGKGKDAPAVILQGHVDMVTEKNAETKHDFDKDPILLRKFEMNAGETWLGAKGTTLGADNGIGVAAALALLETPVDDETVILPPLEALFTIDEETGLTGATELNAEELGLTGKTMLNLDTEEWGELYVGCAGGGESTLSFPFSRESKTLDDSTIVEIRVEGLMGGHSGINIHEGRANAIVLCALAAQTALEDSGVSLVSITGGDKHNAIPREARAIFSVSTSQAKEAVEKAVKECGESAKAEYGALETNLRVFASTYENEDICSDEKEQLPMEGDSAKRLINMLLALPHGPLKFSHAMPDLVETSNNIASISMGEDNTATILCSTRSSISQAMESTRDRITAIANLAGANIEKSEAYPGWNPNMDSPLLQLGKDILSRKLDGKSPGVKAIHAGLECGLLIEKLGGDVDALSFGPSIQGAHSPDERIHTDTVPPFFDLVQDILLELAQQK